MRLRATQSFIDGSSGFPVTVNEGELFDVGESMGLALLSARRAERLPVPEIAVVQNRGEKAVRHQARPIR